jgi:eukaryotic-like serine/threonine-protein kinase
VAFGLNNVGTGLSDLGRPDEARAAHSQAKAILQKVADADPSTLGYQRNLAYTHGRIGRLLQQTGHPARALAEFEQESPILKELASVGDSRYRDSLAICETNKASVQLALARPDEARTSCDRAISIREDQVKANPAGTGHRSGLAASLLRSGQVRRATGDAVGAADDGRRAIALYVALPPRSYDDAVLEAGCHALLSGLPGLPGSSITASDGVIEAERAMDILRGLFANSYRGQGLRTEPALDPLRARPDFQLLMMDVAFPVEPFVPQQ